eukprot:Unigene3036_Nuclearia_a/m.9336 Unigene3036_Nuclearia_a/g.9336  ORF Unigene3036_Nuclearia_a/g.9336 Unigene3036_Nuclearia_a/m.9336 type:complete len:345 (-) Unigene3036_Nuclearia_a:5306-6340(-)
MDRARVGHGRQRHFAQLCQRHLHGLVAGDRHDGLCRVVERLHRRGVLCHRPIHGHAHGRAGHAGQHGCAPGDAAPVRQRQRHALCHPDQAQPLARALLARGHAQRAHRPRQQRAQLHPGHAHALVLQLGRDLDHDRDGGDGRGGRAGGRGRDANARVCRHARLRGLRAAFCAAAHGDGAGHGRRADGRALVLDPGLPQHVPAQRRQLHAQRRPARQRRHDRRRQQRLARPDHHAHDHPGQPSAQLHRAEHAHLHPERLGQHRREHALGLGHLGRPVRDLADKLSRVHDHDRVGRVALCRAADGVARGRDCVPNQAARLGLGHVLGRAPGRLRHGAQRPGHVGPV